MAPRKRFCFDADELRALYLNEWKSPKEIAIMAECSRDLVYHYLRVYGIEKRPRCENLSGKRFGYLTVLRFSGIGPQGSEWVCRCVCGNEVVVSANALKRNNKSCGCKVGSWNVTHGMSKTRQYNIWQGMKTRCTNRLCINYDNYGGRGICLSEKWESFDGFWEDMGDSYKPGLTLDRIDNNGGYCKENCRWVTPREQCYNKRTNHIVEYNGETLPVTAWADRYGLDNHRLFADLANSAAPESVTLAKHIRRYAKRGERNGRNMGK
jgi:hypothetical protein